MSEADARWFLTAFKDVLARMHRFPGPAWNVIADIGKMALSSRGR